MTVQPKRHFAKAITWRIIASIATFLIGWAVTGDMNFGMAIGVADVFIKIGLYYLHERIWYHSRFGIIPSDNNKKGVSVVLDGSSKNQRKSG